MNLESLETAAAAGLAFLESSFNHSTGISVDCTGLTRKSLKKSKTLPAERFTSILFLDLLGDKMKPSTYQDVVNLLKPTKEGVVQLYQYYFTYTDFPDDIDDTCLLYYVFLKEKLLKRDNTIFEVARLISENTGNLEVGAPSESVMKVYMPPCDDFRRNRVDACVLSNAMRFFYAIGCESLAKPTEEFLIDWLVSRKYLNGAWHYSNPQVFLYLYAKALRENKEQFHQLREIILGELDGLDEDLKHPLDVSLYILIFYTVATSTQIQDDAKWKV